MKQTEQSINHGNKRGSNLKNIYSDGIKKLVERLIKQRKKMAVTW